MNRKYKILALFGQSGAGKDTIQQWVIKHIPKTKGIVSYTTRPKRDYEINGIDYYFIDSAAFETKSAQGLMLESSEFRQWHYGTSIGELSYNHVNVGVFNIEGIQSLLADGRVEVLPVWIQCAPRVRLERCFNREQDPDYKEICRRFVADEEDFEKINFDYVVFDNSDNDREWFNIQNLPRVKAFLG